ncbi:hypothetical protein RCL_jg29498.t1 [Rhizophagus clarus]|uniref:Uncharacterized protein n=1 Tax=Rhizophagus clarus TaxID=94130 RepID=A0A8H3L0S0_9GLOM|nr:hypothetical protein RCL_jg29498.t1 [Rhizophagus clarus]
MNIDQPESSEKLVTSANKQDHSNESYHNKMRSLAIFDNICLELWDHIKLSELFTNYIESLKYFNIAKENHIMVYFKKYQDIEECCKTSFTFNYKEIINTMDWFNSLSADKHKQSKKSKRNLRRLPKTSRKRIRRKRRSPLIRSEIRIWILLNSCYKF